MINNQDQELPIEQASFSVREEILRANLNHLKGRFEPDETLISAWKTHLPGSIEYPDTVQSQHLSAIEPVLGEIGHHCRGPIILEGISPPWLFKSLLDAPSPEGHPSFRQRILILQADAVEFLDGLSFVDLGEQLADDRVLCFVGEDASARLLEWATQRIDDAPPAIVIQNPLLKAKSQPDANVLMREIDARWTANESKLIQQIKGRPTRDVNYWKNRYADAVTGKEPLRVLIPVSRFTTYLKYAADDVARAFESIGCKAQVFHERDDSTMMSKCNGLRAAVKFDPDLILAINYTRSAMSKDFPADIPHVCWVQDAMSHLFDKNLFSDLGDLDLFVGMIDSSMIRDIGYPKERSRWMPMAALQSKFHASPKTDGFDAEIAWVTHQSEPPIVMKSRLIDEMKIQAPNAADQFSAMLDRVEDAVCNQPKVSVIHSIRSLVDESFFPTGAPQAAMPLRTHMIKTLIIPFAERVFRHQTAQWASNIARRRNWRFKLYGNGWENHPTLSEFACGPIVHDAGLRECYRNSVVQLHASINQVMHQRVSECLFSGGLPLCRFPRVAFGMFSNLLVAEFVHGLDRGCVPDGAEERDGCWYVPYRSDPLASKYVSEILRLGLCDPVHYQSGTLRWTSKHLDSGRAFGQSPKKAQAAKMFASMTDLGFASETQLESLVDRAVQEPDWRANRINEAVGVLPKELTIEGFAGNVIEFVQSSLQSSVKPIDDAREQNRVSSK